VDLISRSLGTDPDPAIAASAGAFDWAHVAPRYDEALADLL
jgi:hypothetical protein